ncbi:MAG: hypothetical protein ACTH1D_06610 [Mycobacteriaceae bacterium]|uniref:hypothetical protein n=1 Tax=Corynebacterium sp. TaxID=1720 RepID=UPI003F9A8FC5
METFIGDLPTWLTFAVAGVAAVVAWTQWKDQKEALTRERRREHREHASQLSAWLEKRSNDTDGGYTLGVRIHNFSDLTFGDVEITVKLGSEEDVLSTRLRTCPPGDIFIPKNPQSEKYPFSFPERIIAEEDGWYQPYINTDKFRVLALSFHDNSGTRWRLDDRGILDEVGQDRIATQTARVPQAPSTPTSQQPAHGWGR